MTCNLFSWRSAASAEKSNPSREEELTTAQAVTKPVVQALTKQVPEENILYLAYGANTNQERLNILNAKFVAIIHLPKQALTFSKKSIDGSYKSAFVYRTNLAFISEEMNLCQKVDGEVFAVLCEMPKNQLSQLRQLEGLPNDGRSKDKAIAIRKSQLEQSKDFNGIYYEHIIRKIKDIHGTNHENILSYYVLPADRVLLTKDHKENKLRPNKEYLNLIVHGLQSYLEKVSDDYLELYHAYIKKLENILIIDPA